MVLKFAGIARERQDAGAQEPTSCRQMPCQTCTMDDNRFETYALRERTSMSTARPAIPCTISDETPYWIIDVLPMRVPEARADRYALVARLLTSQPQMADTYARFSRFLLKLNCYVDLAVAPYDEAQQPFEPSAEELVALVQGLPAEGGRCLRLVAAPAAGTFVLDGSDHYLTLYQPTDELLELVRTLAHGEGLFVWQPPQD